MTERVRCPDCVGVATITTGSANGGSISFHTDAWCAHDLSELWGGPRLRMDNVTIPSQAGVDPRAPVIDADERTIPMVFGGGYDRTGAAHADPETGLEVNLDWWRDNVVAVPATAAGTRTLTLTKPSGAAVSGPVQVVRFQVGITVGFHATAVCRVLLVDGELT